MLNPLLTIALAFVAVCRPAPAHGVSTAEPLAVPFERTALDEAFAAEFGAPSSPEFAALDEPMREAVERFFLYGPGAVRQGRTIDAVTSSGNGVVAASGSWTLPQVIPVPGYPGLFDVTIHNTGSGYLEKFLLQVPDVFPSLPTPLIVAFHRFGVSHGDVLFSTTFVTEVRTRGWYLVAPLGATPENFGSLASQVNVAAALDYVRAHAPIDPQRIYGVGFSMGGGGCASYAARHLDPAGTMFAALVNHTGSVSLAHAYANDPGAQPLMDGLFGGPPAAQPFAYQRCSTIDLHPQTGLVGAGTDMARNLRHVPIRSWMASNDPDPYLPLQTQAFHNHVQAMNPANVLTVVQASVHSWSTLDETAVCDWFAPKMLQHPTMGTTLADRNGAWHRFQVEQDAPGAFTPFTWFVNASQNQIEFFATANLRRISVASVPLGLVYSGSLRLSLSTADGLGDQVLFLGVLNAPSTVLRNGQAASGVFDPIAHTFLVNETSGASNMWELVF